MTTPRGRPTFTTIGVPIDSVGLGRAEPHGTELSPDAIRASGLARLGWADLGDLDVRIPDHDRDEATGLVGIEGVLETTDVVRGAVAGLFARATARSCSVAAARCSRARWPGRATSSARSA